MVNKTTKFKKQGKPKKDLKKGGKKAATHPEKPKGGPKPDTDCYYCNGKGHWKRNCSKYLADPRAALSRRRKSSAPAPVTEEANDNDHETSSEVATEPRMSTRNVPLLIDLPDSRKAVENKWIFKRKTDADVSGYVFILNGAAVSWCSSKQCTVAKSSTESEYIAASEASSEAVWMKRFIVELGVVLSALDPLVIYCDNMGAIANAQEPRSQKEA
ncbi:hypothetical protein QYE76_033558 [Lolium multiflorum]|uniref:CCHC-type domain-containing protein n=1 Tax=Lolium multiflorum TaxID=4521 RepID=A0AAD8QVH9_LOLMU|nr:hypothetical protein QYE76_033558 [Lolium multiflorum]